jgi:hypothetical protein
MKLYTEEEVIRAIELSDSRSTDEVLAGITPIELPSDDEISQEFKYSSENWEVRQALEEGAKWMRNKILNNTK